MHLSFYTQKEDIYKTIDLRFWLTLGEDNAETSAT